MLSLYRGSESSVPFYPMTRDPRGMSIPFFVYHLPALFAYRLFVYLHCLLIVCLFTCIV